MKNTEIKNRLMMCMRSINTCIQRWNNSDKSQAKALKRVGVFFLATLMLTLIARGTYGATMPVVSVVNAGLDTIEQSIHTTGTISLASSIDISVPESMPVSMVFVQQGEQIKTGDTLARFDSASIDNEIAQLKANIAQLDEKLSSLQENQTADSSVLEREQQALAWAEEDYKKLCDDADEIDDRIKQQEAKIAQLNEQLTSLQSNPDADPAAIESLQQAIASALEDHEELCGEKDAITDNLQSAQRSVEETQLSLKQAKRTYNQDVDSAQATEDMNLAEAESVKLEISTAQKRMEELTGLQNNGYLLLADQDGTIQTVAITAGTETQRVAFTLTDTSSGFIFRFQPTVEQAENVSCGMSASITQGSTKSYSSVSSITDPDSSGNVAVSVRLEGTDWDTGQADVDITLSRNTYSYTLPISAVHTDNNGNFIYIVEEHNTTLGLNNVLVRIPVTIEETGETKIAVSGTLTSKEIVVSASTKPLTEGCKVRVES